MKKYHLIAGVALALTATPAAANGFYMFGEVGFAEVEADIEDGVDPVDGDGYRAGIGTGFSLVVPLTGVYLGAEISAALSYIDNDSDIEYTVDDDAGLPTGTMKLTARYNTEEKWRAAASADAGVRLLPGFFIFARLSYAETGGEIERTAIGALDSTDAPIPLDNEADRTAVSEALANFEQPDEDDLSGEEIGVGLLYNVPFTPISMRGIVTVDPELAFSAALVWRF